MIYAVKCTDVSKHFSLPTRGVKDLILRRVHKREGKFNRSWALKNISIEVPKGSAFAIVGHNGTGKSTLLCLILGTLFPDTGNISVDGKVVSLLELGAGFHPELTGRENIELYAAILGMSKSYFKENIGKIITFSELGGSIDQPIRTYSAGMIARLGFSVITHVEADILLIDEVLAVGDAEFKAKCYRFFEDFRDNGGTLIIVSHELEELRRICDSGVYIEQGELDTAGTIEEVISDYKSRYEI